MEKKNPKKQVVLASTRETSHQIKKGEKTRKKRRKQTKVDIVTLYNSFGCQSAQVEK